MGARSLANKGVYFSNIKNIPINNIYNVCEDTISQNNKSIKRSREYLQKHFYKSKSYLEMSYSPLHQPKKYVSELNNRVSAQFAYAKSIGFDTPLFLTITVPSHLKPTKQIKQKTKTGMKIIVDNPNFTGDKYRYVKEASEYLSEKWRGFLNAKVFKNMKNQYGKRPFYISVKEPTLDGTPHLHILLFLPKYYLDEFKIAFYRYFGLRKGIDFKHLKTYKQAKAYVLKYIFKTFKKNDKTGDGFDLITHWFMANRIRRFSSSRGIIPLYVFRRINYNRDYRSMLQCTIMMNARRLVYYELDGRPLVFVSDKAITNIDDRDVTFI